MEHFSAVRKDEFFPFTSTRVELEGIIPDEIIQSEKDNYHMVSLTCGR